MTCCTCDQPATHFLWHDEAYTQWQPVAWHTLQPSVQRRVRPRYCQTCATRFLTHSLREKKP